MTNKHDGDNDSTAHDPAETLLPPGAAGRLDDGDSGATLLPPSAADRLDDDDSGATLLPPSAADRLEMPRGSPGEVNAAAGQPSGDGQLSGDGQPSKDSALSDTELPSLNESAQLTIPRFSSADTDDADADTDDLDTYETGSRIERFLVLDPLGTGGMGVVVSAYDPDLDRKVAIKLLRRGRLGGEAEDDARKRLQAEARAMARLAHPNVVMVHEVGVWHGQVFVAMEYVDEGTLADWLAAEPRDWRQILAMFVQASHGLAAAHTAGLVHRDFKLENVLVGSDGRARVSDFGIARGNGEPLGGDDGELHVRANLARSLATQTGSVLGTPIYMAPEQHEANVVDARADQFSFCVSLYIALYAQRPFAGKTYSELKQNVCAGNLRPPPSEHSVPDWVQRIIERGLRVDPAARFESMAVVAQLLSTDPSVARKRRWLRAAFAAVLLATIVVAVFGLTRSAGDHQTSCQLPVEQLAGVWDAKTKDALQHAFAATNISYAAAIGERVAGSLDGRIQRWKTMWTASCRATRVRGDQSQVLLDRRTLCLNRRIGDVRELVGVLTDKPDKNVVKRALSAVAALPPIAACGDKDALLARVPPPESPELRLAVATLDTAVSRVTALIAAGKFKRAQTESTKMQTQVRQLKYAPLLARALYQAGHAAIRAGAAKDGEKILREALQAAADARDDQLAALVWIRLIRAVGYYQQRPKDALTMRDAAEAAVKRAGNSVQDRSSLLTQLATVYDRSGKLKLAKTTYEQVIKLLGEDVSDESQSNRMAALNNLAIISYRQGNYKSARDHFAAAAAYFERALGPDHPNVADAVNNLAVLTGRTGDLVLALRHHERALALRKRIYGPNHSAVASSYNNIALLHERAGRYKRAVELNRKALAIKQTFRKPDHPDIAQSLNNLGRSLSVSKPKEARQLFLRALAIREKSLGRDHHRVADVLENLGTIIMSSDPVNARKYLQRSLAIREKKLGKQHPHVASSLLSLGTFERQQGRCKAATPLLARALKLQKAAYSADSVEVAKITVELAWCDIAYGRLKRARVVLEAAVKSTASRDDVHAAEARFALANALWKKPGQDRARAMKLALSANATMKRVGSVPQAITTWLRKHKAQ